MAARLRFGNTRIGRIIFRAGSFSNGIVRHDVRSFSVASKGGKERIKENPFFDKYRDKLKHVVRYDDVVHNSEHHPMNRIIACCGLLYAELSDATKFSCFI